MLILSVLNDTKFKRDSYLIAKINKITLSRTAVNLFGVCVGKYKIRGILYKKCKHS